MKKKGERVHSRWADTVLLGQVSFSQLSQILLYMVQSNHHHQRASNLGGPNNCECLRTVIFIIHCLKESGND